MNILLMNSVQPDCWGGGEKWMLVLAEGLRRKGHAVFFCGQENSVFLQRCYEADFEIFPLKIKSDFSPVNILKLAHFYRKKQVQTVIANFNKDVRIAGLAGRIVKHPVVVARNGLAILPNTAVYRHTYPLLADGIITNSSEIKNKYLSYQWMNPDFIRVINNGIDTGLSLKRDASTIRKKYNLPANQPVIGIFGRLVPQKQHTLFLEVAKNLLEEWPEAIFLIVGDGPQKEDICKYALELGILDNIYMIGFQQEVAELFSLCDLVLLTSETEGLPNVVIEAMLLSRPVVAFDVGGVKELIRSDLTGRVVPPNDIYLMTQRAQELLMRPELRESIGQNSRKFIKENFSLEKMVDEVEIYLTALFGRKHPEINVNGKTV